MTNGVYEITNSKGKVTQITLGYNAAMEFEKRYFAHILAKDSPNQAVMLTDLVYSGMYCNSMKNGLKIKPYSAAYELIEDIAELDTFPTISAEIWATYYESKWGQDFENRLNEAKKKMLVELENLN